MTRSTQLLRRAATGALVGLLAGVATGALPARAAVVPAVQPTPGWPAGLPAGIEDPASYVKQSACDPTAKPGTVALGRLLVATYPGTSFGAARACGADGIASEHYEGRALDWMTSVRTPGGAERATALLDWLLAPDATGTPFAAARRLGVMYVIWNDRIWGAYNPAAGWRPYSSCAQHPEPAWDTSCHRDHVHLSLSWAGAMARTSFWSHRVAAEDYGPCRPADLNWAPPYRAANPRPCPRYPAVTAPPGLSGASALFGYSGAQVGPGSTGPVVTAVQRALGLPADGGFGAATAQAVSAFRVAHALPAGEIVDGATWRALLAAAGTGPARSTGTPGASPAPAPNPLRRYATTTLRQGARGAAVQALQRALRLKPVDGVFGRGTRAAVIAFQRAHHLPADGVVGARTWKALGA